MSKDGEEGQEELILTSVTKVKTGGGGKAAARGRGRHALKRQWAQNLCPEPMVAEVKLGWA